MAVTVPFDFDDEWASATEWARMYRGLGMQVMPAHNPSDGGQWKRPAVETWLEFRDSLTTDSLFNRWFDPQVGEHRLRKNMGMITGAASGGLFMLDLDVKPGSGARAWFDGLLAAHNNSSDLDTPMQRTGGGGWQVLLRAPHGWTPPTFKTVMGVDVRGQGGFAMLPPSRHTSGHGYEWLAGHEPWAVDPITAPDWLIEAIEALREEHGGGPPGGQERTPADAAKNAFGLDVDDREHKLQAMVWAAVVDLYRDAPIPPPEDEQQAEIERLWTQYEQTTKSRLTGPQYDGLDNAARLEKEGRGLSELRRKWTYAMRRWDGKVREAARLPRPHPYEPRAGPAETASPDDDDPLGATPDIEEPPPRLPKVTPFHGQAPARQWLVTDWVVEGTVNSLYAPSGMGKSQIALQLGAAVSLGQPWFGLPTKAGPVLMISCEDDAGELHRRTDSIKLAMGYALGWPFPDFHIADRVGAENRLAVSSRTGDIAPGPFLAQLEAEIEQLKPALLILDTLADVYSANEIDRGVVNYFLKAILGGLIARQQAQGHSLTILLLGHPSDSGRAAGGKGYSGSGAWEAGVRSRLYLTRKDDDPPDERTLTRGKANYASAGEDTGIRLAWVDGVFMAETEIGVGDPLLLQAKARTLRLIRQAWDERTPYTQQRGHRRYVFKALLKVLTDEGVERATARQAIRDLIEDGPVDSQRRGGQAGLRVID